MAKLKIEWPVSERKDIRRDADMEVKMDEETLKEIDYKLNKIKRHLVRITDAVEDICSERYHLEILIDQVREELKKGGENE